MLKLRRLNNGWSFRLGRPPNSPAVYIRYFGGADSERLIRGNIGRLYFDRAL